jgi:hypothetical protein|tara:strand:+ start:293 stop:493 length:201 start_codon:yes stop_codon:yes gene_type:complete
MENIKDKNWQKRQFFLSSFVRMNISLTTKVYQFIDRLINSDWKSSYESLDDIDREILRTYEDFMNG